MFYLPLEYPKNIPCRSSLSPLNKSRTSTSSYLRKTLEPETGGTYSWSVENQLLVTWNEKWNGKSSMVSTRCWSIKCEDLM